MSLSLERKQGYRFSQQPSFETGIAFKHEIIPQLKGVPYVAEDKPVVCTWYPTIKTVLLWNLSENKETFTVKLDDKKHSVEIGGLDAELVRL